MSESSSEVIYNVPKLDQLVPQWSVLQVCGIFGEQKPKVPNRNKLGFGRSRIHIERHRVSQIRIISQRFIPRCLLCGYCTHDFCHCMSFLLVLTNYCKIVPQNRTKLLPYTSGGQKSKMGLRRLKSKWLQNCLPPGISRRKFLGFCFGFFFCQFCFVFLASGGLQHFLAASNCIAPLSYLLF